MQLVNGAILQQQENLVPMDFTDDYRASGAVRAHQLPLPARADVIAAVEAVLSVSPDVVDQSMTALAAGRHLIFYGPPGTGKTSIAKALADAYGCEAITHTASADWTPFETAGGLQLNFENGVESMKPHAGIITSAIVACLNHVAAEMAGESTDYKAAWLVIDEINRANIDAAFGPYFNALDADHPTVALPFMDEPRKVIDVPARFRVIGTMNTYDKNFLFRLSYALTRRFALIELGVPDNDDEVARDRERTALLMAVRSTLALHNIMKSDDDVAVGYEVALSLVYQRLVRQIRSTGEQGLHRGIGFAQIAAALSQAGLAYELGYGEPGSDHDRLIDAVDRAVVGTIVPQLEGLPSSRLKDFVAWWESDTEVQALRRSLAGTKALISGLDLFLADAD